MFEDEVLEDPAEDSYTFLHSHYFGPASPPSPAEFARIASGHEADIEDDVSLNSLSVQSSPKKFLKAPLFDIRQRGRSRHYLDRFSTPVTIISNPCPKCVKGTCRLKKHQMYLTSSSSGSSAYSGSPQNRVNKQKTSTPEQEEDAILRRTDATLPGFFRPGRDVRMDGDGSDEMDPSHLSDELARFSGTPVGFLRDQYRPSYRLYGSCRAPPDGKERLSTSPLVTSRSGSPGPGDLDSELRVGREDSLDSDHELPSVSVCSMSGSMLDLVENAREVRRLIREASFDSTGSDLSLDFSINENLGASTAEGLDTLAQGLNKLLDNCGNIEDDISYIPPARIVSSKSSMSGLSQFSETGRTEPDLPELRREGSIPDLRALQRSLRSSKGLWKLTDFSGLSEYGSRQASVGSDSLEWDSPVHGWSELRPRARVPLAYSSGVSESGDDVGSLAGSGLDPWEWDDCYYIQDGDVLEPIETFSGHRSWLPDISTELDLEAELRWRELSSTSTSTSARSSLDREMLVYRRQPPSGRSSVDRSSRFSTSSRGSSGSEDLTLSAPNPPRSLRRSRSTSGRDTSPILPGSRRRSTDLGANPSLETSVCSTDTGVGSMDSSVSSVSSCFLTSSINLSPVREAREPPQSPVFQPPASPMSTSATPVSPEIRFGDISTTDTVIKISVPAEGRFGRNGVAKALFGAAEEKLAAEAEEDRINENNVVLDVRLTEQSFN